MAQPQILSMGTLSDIKNLRGQASEGLNRERLLEPAQLPNRNAPSRNPLASMQGEAAPKTYRRRVDLRRVLT